MNIVYDNCYSQTFIQDPIYYDSSRLKSAWGDQYSKNSENKLLPQIYFISVLLDKIVILL